jgi:endonuclease/exonuclease/phosphatase family metal-dependent hydrolase
MRLRVVSLNVWALPTPIGRHVRERIEAVLRDLAPLACDIALFQEVWREETREQLRAGGRALGLPHHDWPPGDASRSGGLLALSRLPIEAPHFRPYTLRGLPHHVTQMDYWSGKGVASFRVSTEAGPLRVLNTHMHARYAPVGVEDDYIGHRAAEVIELADALRRLREPLILAGDLNMQDDSPEYGLLRQMTGLDDAAATLDARQPTSTLDNVWRRARGALHESRIDYLFSRAGERTGLRPVAARRVFDQEIEISDAPGSHSDHAGVLADFEIGGPGLPAHVIPEAAFVRARELLDNGRRRARTRRRYERLGWVASAAAVGGVVSARRRDWTRRRFLRTGLGAAGGLAAFSGVGLFATAERFVPHELAEFDEIEALLGRIAAARPGGAPPGGALHSLR